MLALNFLAFKNTKQITKLMTISMKMVCIAKTQARKNQLECSDVPSHYLVVYNYVCYILD